MNRADTQKQKQTKETGGEGEGGGENHEEKESDTEKICSLLKKAQLKNSAPLADANSNIM